MQHSLLKDPMQALHSSKRGENFSKYPKLRFFTVEEWPHEIFEALKIQKTIKNVAL